MFSMAMPEVEPLQHEVDQNDLETCCFHLQGSINESHGSYSLTSEEEIAYVITILLQRKHSYC